MNNWDFARFIWGMVRFNVLFVLSLIGLVFVLVNYFNIGFLVLWFVLGLVFLLKDVLLKDFSFKRFLVVFGVTGLVLAFFYVFGGGFAFLFLLGFVVFRLWMGRDVLLGSIERVESTLFGEPLIKSKKRKEEGDDKDES